MKKRHRQTPLQSLMCVAKISMLCLCFWLYETHLTNLINNEIINNFLHSPLFSISINVQYFYYSSPNAYYFLWR